MQYESVLNKKEYLHLTFQVSVFLIMSLIVELDNELFVACSFLFIGIVSLAYFMQLNALESDSLSTWKFKKEEGDTDYNIVAPFGSSLIIFWIAFVDFNTQPIVSKYTGVLLMLSVISSFQATAEIKRRIKVRLVSDNSEVIHNVLVWGFNAGVWFLAIKFFITTGVWEWETPGLIDIFNTILGMDEYR